MKEYLVNSVAIIQEPPQVELVGMNGAPVDPLAKLGGVVGGVVSGVPPTVPLAPVRLSEKQKVDNKLKEDVLKIINADANVQSDHDKVKQMMKIDKILSDRRITSVAQNEQFGGNQHKSNHRSDIKIPPHLMPSDDDDVDDDDVFNHRASQGSRELMNLEFDEETTVDESTQKQRRDRFQIIIGRWFECDSFEYSQTKTGASSERN